MPRAKFPAEDIRQLGDGDASVFLRAPWIEFVQVGGEEQVQPGCGELVLILGQGARIAFVVLAFAELNRVDEDADHGAIGEFACARQ